MRFRRAPETVENPPMSTAKDAARQIIDRLPDQATWDDIMYELYVKQKIEEGIQAADEGRTVSHSEAKRRLLGDAD
jgi:predicted transcriptional regulator